MERLAKEPVMPNLAVSLHATTNATRDRIAPINRKYPLEQLLDTCRRFPLNRRRQIMFEYVLLDGVNDTPEDARRLASLLGDIKAKVNLLPLNAAPGIPVRAPVRRARQRLRQDPGGPRYLGVGAEEPRPRHPGGVRPADRRGTEEMAGAKLAGLMERRVALTLGAGRGRGSRRRSQARAPPPSAARRPRAQCLLPDVPAVERAVES